MENTRREKDGKREGERELMTSETRVFGWLRGQTPQVLSRLRHSTPFPCVAQKEKRRGREEKEEPEFHPCQYVHPQFGLLFRAHMRRPVASELFKPNPWQKSSYDITRLLFFSFKIFRFIFVSRTFALLLFHRMLSLGRDLRCRRDEWENLKKSLRKKFDLFFSCSCIVISVSRLPLFLFLLLLYLNEMLEAFGGQLYSFKLSYNNLVVL